MRNDEKGIVQAGFLAVMLAVGAGCGSTSSSSALVADGGTPDGGTTTQADIAVTETDLVTDTAGGTRVDPNVVNPWGIAKSAQGPFWISDNGTGKASVLDFSGGEVRAPVTIPLPSGSKATNSAPTGVVFNDLPQSNFLADLFLFATEDGTVAGWQQGDVAQIRVDNSTKGAVYKGIAIAHNTLFVTNFNAGTVEMYDNNFGAMGTLTDSSMPTGFAPFNVTNVAGRIFISFAKQDALKHDDVAGVGNGFIDVFNPQDNTMTRLISNGALNSPWGMVIAPANFGAASGKLLVGNFGDGLIHIFEPTTGAQIGQVQKNGAPLVIDGVWGLIFGNGSNAGPINTLFFTAGPGEEQHGVFGSLTVSP